MGFVKSVSLKNRVQCRPIKLGIDATNISSGGGLTHLIRLLHAADLNRADIETVTIWTSLNTAQHLPSRSWLKVATPRWCNGNMLSRAIGQQFQIPKYLRAAGCDVLFSPGGTLPWKSPVPAVTMSQNMLPFEPTKADLFGRWSLMRFKMRMLRYTQTASFLRAQGLIFLSEYARNVIGGAVKGLSAKTALIPHGIEERFVQAPRRSRLFTEFTEKSPFKVLYVSILMPYKHQVEVAEAIYQLKSQGVPIEARFVGAIWGEYGRSFHKLREKLDPNNSFLRCAGHVPFEELHSLYRDADAFLFASSCENLPNILIEAMAAGLPIACSDCGPMPEVLGEAGIYFDPTSPKSISEAILKLAKDHTLRTMLASAGWQRAKMYSWEKCAYETFRFIGNIARQNMGEC